jgi:hypothetical protein
VTDDDEEATGGCGGTKAVDSDGFGSAGSGSGSVGGGGVGIVDRRADRRLRDAMLPCSSVVITDILLLESCPWLLVSLSGTPLELEGRFVRFPELLLAAGVDIIDGGGVDVVIARSGSSEREFSSKAESVQVWPSPRSLSPIIADNDDKSSRAGNVYPGGAIRSNLKREKQRLLSVAVR